jgi:DNA-binding NarL/FixJ family response regulator
MDTLRVMIVDDHGLLRAGFRALLDAIEGIEVVAEASNGTDALVLIDKLRPAIVLSDIAMPGLNGLELVARVSRDFPEVKTILLSMYSTEEYVCQAMRSGAAGYLLKDSNPDELERAVESVARGDTYLSPAVSKHIIADYVRRTQNEAGPADLLTPRQREILQMIASGQTTKAIARTLGISIKTVETHRTQLMERLEIHDVAGLVRFAIRAGLVDLAE